MDGYLSDVSDSEDSLHNILVTSSSLKIFCGTLKLLTVNYKSLSILMVNTNCIVTATANSFSYITFFSKIEHHPVNLLQEGKCIFVSVCQTH